MILSIQELVQEMAQWHLSFLEKHQYGHVNLNAAQLALLEQEWNTRTQYIPNDTFIFGVPFYDFMQPMRVAGAEKFFGKRDLTVIDFFQYVHPALVGSYFLMGQASYQLAARPEFKAHAMKGSYSSKLELAVRHHANNQYYSVVQYSEPILFDEKNNLLYHINTYRIGNEINVKELSRYMAQIIHGPIEKHNDYSKLLVEEAGKILCQKLEAKEKRVLGVYLKAISQEKKYKTAEIAQKTELSPRMITAINEKLLRIGNTYLPFQQFTTAHRFVEFMYEHRFLTKKMLE